MICRGVAQKDSLLRTRLLWWLTPNFSADSFRESAPAPDYFGEEARCYDFRQIFPIGLAILRSPRSRSFICYSTCNRALCFAFRISFYYFCTVFESFWRGQQVPSFIILTYD